MKFPTIALATLFAGGFLCLQVGTIVASSNGEGDDTRRVAGRRMGGGSEAVNVSLETATPTSVSPVTVSYGRVSAPHRVEIVPEVAGYVSFVSPGISEGAHVSEEDLLLRIGNEDALAEVRDAKIDIEIAQTSLAQAEREVEDASGQLTLQGEALELSQGEYERIRSMADSGISSTSDLEAVRSALISARQAIAGQTAALSAAQSQVRQSEIALRAAKAKLEDTRRALQDHAVTAPISGDLSGFQVSVGKMLSASSIGEIIDLSNLEVRLVLSQAGLDRVSDAAGRALPLSVEVRKPGSAAVSTGVIDRLAIQLGDDGEDQTIAVVRMDSAQTSRLRPGDFVEATIQEGSLDPVVVLPSSAMLGDSFVFVVADDETLEQWPVRVLRRIGETVVIDATIVGKSYVSDPDGNLAEGVRVAQPGSVGGGSRSSATIGVRDEASSSDGQPPNEDPEGIEGHQRPAPSLAPGREG